MRPNHPELLATIMSFSLFNELRGRFDLAEPLLEEWLDGLIETCGLNDSSTILAKNSLAIAYEKQNKLDQALPLYSDCYQYHRSISGPCAYKTYNVLFPLTECEYKLGNHQASISRLEQFCESCKLEDGENSFQYARAQNRLGRAYSRIGDLDKAETVLLDGYDQLSAADGVDDESIRVVELRNAASRLAGVYQELKNTEAFEFWRDRHRQWSIKVQQGVVQDNVQAIGNDHPQTVSAKRELAELLVKADKDSEAWPIMMELFEHFQEKDGFAAESTFDILIRLAIVDHALKQFSESDARLQNYLDQTRDEPGFHWQRAKAKSYLGRAKIELGEYEAAESTLLAAFEAFQQLEADADPVLWRPEMRKVANRLMELYRRMENDDERAAWREKYRFYKQKPELDD